MRVRVRKSFKAALGIRARPNAKSTSVVLGGQGYIALVLLALLLTACGGGRPTATSPAATSTPAVAAKNGQYKDGTYTGPEVDATYGLVQVQAVVQNGKIANVQFLEYPNDRRTSVRINSYAVPYLQQEAVQVQSANVDWITGATLTSQAFQMSLQAALAKAKG